METKARTIYAIRISGHVELRASRTGLKAIVSKLTKFRTIKRDQWVDDPEDEYGDGGYFAEKDEKIPLILQQTFFVGGSVVGYLNIYKFSKLFKRIPREGRPVKMTPTESQVILSAVWRKKHL